MKRQSQPSRRYKIKSPTKFNPIQLLCLAVIVAAILIMMSLALANKPSPTTEPPGSNMINAIAFSTHPKVSIEAYEQTLCSKTFNVENPSGVSFEQIVWVGYDSNGVIQGFVCLPYNPQYEEISYPINIFRNGYNDEGMNLLGPAPLTYTWKKWREERLKYDD